MVFNAGSGNGSFTSKMVPFPPMRLRGRPRGPDERTPLIIAHLTRRALGAVEVQAWAGARLGSNMED